MGGKRQTVIWAIDPFDKEMKPDSSLLKKLSHWSQRSDYALQPVYALSMPAKESPAFRAAAGFVPNQSAALKIADDYLKSLGIVGARSAEVLLAESSLRENVVHVLLQFAKEKNAVCVVVSSHGRSGLGRFLMGSFAENILAQAHCPVLFLTHNRQDGEPRAQFERVFFPTDFSKRSKQVFTQFLQQAKRDQFEITLFHSIVLPATAMIAGAESPVVISPNFFQEQIEWAKEEGEGWVKLSEAGGVKACLIVKDEGVGNDVAETILATAEQEKSDLIVMCSVTHGLGSFVLGSVAKDVFRSHRCPVWVYGPKFEEGLV